MPLLPTTLVLSSGGVRGVAHTGALVELERAGLLSSVHTYVGTSAGAVVAMLLAVGYTADEVERLALGVDLRGALGQMSLAGMMTLPTHYGAIESGRSRLGDIVNALVRRSRAMAAAPRRGARRGAAAGVKSLTLAGLRARTGATLVVCATDVGSPLHPGADARTRALYFGPDRTPDMPVTVAVLASCAIPLVFRPVRGRFVDGALVDHYPFRRSPDGPCRTIGVVITDRPAPAQAPELPGVRVDARRLGGRLAHALPPERRGRLRAVRGRRVPPGRPPGAVPRERRGRARGGAGVRAPALRRRRAGAAHAERHPAASPVPRAETVGATGARAAGTNQTKKQQSARRRGRPGAVSGCRQRWRWRRRRDSSA